MIRRMRIRMMKMEGELLVDRDFFSQILVFMGADVKGFFVVGWINAKAQRRKAF